MGRLSTTAGSVSTFGGGGRLAQGQLGKVDLTTVLGLQQTAQESGLGARATKVLARKGEDPQQIFSGGFVQDTFDTLNLLQHGVTGVLQGKGFAQGVKTRASFSEKDQLGQFGIPGMIAGVALDIAVDPLTYLGGFGILKRAVTVTAKGVAAVTKQTVGRIPIAQRAGDQLAKMFIYRAGQDPVYKELANRTLKNIGTGVDNVLTMARPLTKLNPAAQRAFLSKNKKGQIIRRSAEELSQLFPEEILAKARPAFVELDRLGRESVDLGLLDKEIYEANIGSYIANLYRKKEAPGGVVQKVKEAFETKPKRIDLSRFMKRKEIPEEVREAMGEILEAGYPTAKALVQLTRANENAKFFAVVASKWGQDALEEGLKKLPNVPTLGKLSGKYVPEPIFDDIQEIIRQKTNLDKAMGKIVAGFKYNKVILNPATHARNVMSNFILNSFEGLSPFRIDIYAKAAKSIVTKDEVYKEAKSMGLGLDTFAAGELRSILGFAEGGKFKNFANKIADIYQKEEEYAKMAQYIFQKSKGLSPQDAYLIAERATFNYAQVTPFIRRVRESIWGFPFITFTVKATPQVAKTLATKPTKLSNIGKIKVAIENQSDIGELSKERATEPSWVRDGFFIKLPMKDKEGRSAYFDMTYILPFGDLISGNFFERGISRETGLPESIPEAALSKAPFLNIIKELSRNQDFFGNKIFRESDGIDDQLGDIFRHVLKTYTPPIIADQIPYRGLEVQPQQQ